MSIFKNIKTAVKRFLGNKLLALVTCNYRRLQWMLPPRVIKFQKPIRFTDKLIWLKQNSRLERAQILVDKILVRDYVRELVGSECLIPLVGIYNKIGDVAIEDLPDKFVIKPNHASGHVYFGSRNAFQKEELAQVCDPWLEIDYSQTSREYQYRGIKPMLLIEKDMRSVTGGDELPDYKFFCFNGEPLFVQVDLGRFNNHERVYYDMNWERLPFTILYPKSNMVLETPKCFDDMKTMAASLSEGHSFIRIDFYDVNGKAYFGEITFHPDGGYGPFIPDYFDEKFGRLLELNEAS